MNLPDRRPLRGFVVRLQTFASTLALAVLALTFGVFPQAAAANDYPRWAVVVIAGDWRSHQGGDSQAFDNARRDVAQALTTAGFKSSNMVQFSLRPPKPGDGADVTINPSLPIEAFQQMAAQAKDGCLFYLTSHGTPDGAVFGPVNLLSPTLLARIMNETCAGRPSVVIISACYSGVFVGPLADPKRVIITAARPDRSSFGCGDKDKYPYFDNCILQTLPTSKDFPMLARQATACVSKRETEEHLQPPSEPQTWIGAEAVKALPKRSLGKS